MEINVHESLYLFCVALNTVVLVLFMDDDGCYYETERIRADL